MSLTELKFKKIFYKDIENYSQNDESWFSRGIYVRVKKNISLMYYLSVIKIEHGSIKA